MIKLNNSKKILILSGIIGVLIIAIIIFGLFPLYSSINLLDEKIYDKRVKLAIYEQQRQNIESTRDDYFQIKSDADTIAKVFIDKNNFLNLISTLENLATDNQVTQNINLNISSQSDIKDKISITLNTKGNWQNFSKYLVNIENLDFYVNIYDLSINRSGDDIEAVLIAYIYTQ
ncbi:type 4a pilus biogenesis protein PilO [Patescibacteria group bacterium]|nr:type 4a pilus biogenesis protein PilO [Patescibacteria group bacterium]